MRIMLKLVLDCDPDAAWRALHSPRVLAELYGPLLDLSPMDAAGLPTSLQAGADIPVRMILAAGGAAGGWQLGEQLIHVSERTVSEQSGEVRILRDSGIPLTGPLAALDVWDHQMAVSPAPASADKTLWRERLVIGGAAAPVLWPVLWATWQWRAARLRSLASSWSHDHDAAAEQGASTATSPA